MKCGHGEFWNIKLSKCGLFIERDYEIKFHHLVEISPLRSYCALCALVILCIEVLAHKLRTDKNIDGFKIGSLEKTLKLYADDCSIFLTPTAENLRCTVETLNNFYRLSGLKISVSKTTAIYFGSNIDNLPKLCTDIPLNWDSQFTLLGIEFDNKLQYMDKNYDKKIENN